MREYIQEYSQKREAYTDLSNAFYNDAPYTGKYTYEMTILSGIIMAADIVASVPDVCATIRRYVPENFFV